MDHRVVVIGAGITGTALARALSIKGVDHLVLEKRETASDGGLAINLPGNAIAALDRLGLADQVAQLGTPIRRREYRTSAGRLLFRVDEDAFWGKAMRPHAMLRKDLLTILDGGSTDSSVLRGCGVTALEQRKQAIVATLEDGRQLRAELVIGADGVYSTTRAAMLSGDHQKASLIGKASWRFMIPNPGVECWTVFASADAVFLLMPLSQSEAYAWAMPKQSRNGREPPALEVAFAKFPAVVREAIRSALADPSRMHHSPLFDIRLSRWATGRIVLAGDAAHAMAPVWAQGAALGLEDALVLAEELSNISDWNTAIQRYEARRQPRAAHVQAATDRMSRAASLPEWFRTLAMPFIGPRSYASTYDPLKVWP
ncbi:FAD-dependent monooxygenase [Rhizobium leguminosarum]|uniref:FAD-dependent monooxygenase n=1 Tax=Rhizobium leguminosarum TaxID=384 RepID=UPI001441D0AE|nr:FAD-dependent monooxygenase [Rhizobium leguminosarum]NKN03054.1 FAD-dependent monooxygenase [Rhizobium leguminosarum bv. viciae]